MSYKAKKFNVDLELDLSEYIPNTILKSDKVDSKSIWEWSLFAVKEGERITEMQKDIEAYPMSDLMIASRESAVKQIDWFYNKGVLFYEPLPLSELKAILDYINAEISAVKKKSKK